MHRETVGLIDDHKVTVLVNNPSAQRLSEHVGMDSLKLLSELQEFLHSPLDRVCGHLQGEKEQWEMPGGEDLQKLWVGIWGGNHCICVRFAPSPGAMRAGCLATSQAGANPQEDTVTCWSRPTLSPHFPTSVPHVYLPSLREPTPLTPRLGNHPAHFLSDSPAPSSSSVPVSGLEVSPLIAGHSGA